MALLKKISQLIFKHRALLIALLAVALLIFLVKITSEPETSPPEKNQISQIAYKEKILPGISTEKEVIGQFGEPLNIGKWENYSILNYPADSNWKNQIFLKEEKVFLITQQTENDQQTTRDFLLRKYGNPEVILYGPLSPARDLYTYPSLGFAFLGSKYDQSIFQLWYFSPCLKEDFIQDIAPQFNYSAEEPPEEDGLGNR